MLTTDIVARLDERAAAQVATRLKNEMTRAGTVSGEAFTQALNEAANKYKFSADRISSELERQFTSHGQRAGQGFGTGFTSQMARSLPGVSGFASAMSGYEGAAAKTGALAGRALGMAFTTAAGGLLGAAGYTLFKGFERYEQIDAATHRIENLSKTMQAAGQVGLNTAAIMKTVTDVVQGTPIALNEAMQAVTVALGSGVQQGAQLQRYLTDISDMAGYSGHSFSELALVFGQVQAKGRLMGEEVMQFMEKGIPVAKWMQDTFHLTGDAYLKLEEKGQISMRALQKAVEQHAGGMAKAMGETIQGSISNMQTAVARAGANFLGAIFGKPDQNNTMVDALKHITEKLNEVNAWISAHQNEIRDYFQKAAELARELAGAIADIAKYLLQHKDLVYDVVVAYGAWKAIEGVAALITSLKSISTAMSGLPAVASVAAAGISAAFAGASLGILAVQQLLDKVDRDAAARANKPGPPASTAPLTTPAWVPGLPGVGAPPGGFGPAPSALPGVPFVPGLTGAPPLPGEAPGVPGAPGAPGGPPAPGAGDDDGPYFLPPRKTGDDKPHLPKAPVVPFNTALPQGFAGLPMSSELYGAESSYLDARHKLDEKRARQTQLEHDGVATEQDVLDAKNDVIEAQRSFQQNELKLYEERDTILNKHNKQLKTFLSELGDIGAGLDQDFGISKGLAGIAENITKFIANLAAAPLLGALGAQQIKAGYKPGEAGQGALGMLAQSGAFGPQYQGPGSIATELAGGGRSGIPGGGGAAFAPIAGTLPGLAVPAGASVYSGPHTDDTGGALVPRAAAVKAMLQQAFPGLEIGGWRPRDKYAEHSSGEALDIMVGQQNQARGDQINQYLLDHASELGLQYDLWRQQSWNPGQAPRGMEDRGSPTENHMDHVHARFQPGPVAGAGGGGANWFPAAPGATPGAPSPEMGGVNFGGGGSIAPAGFGSGGAPLSPGGGWGGGPGVPGAPGGPGQLGTSAGGPGPGLPGLPNTSNPTRIGGPAPPQGKGAGGISFGGLPMAAGMAAIGGLTGGAGSAAAQSMMQLINRTISFGSQAAAIGVQGLMETFLPSGSELGNNSWLTKIVGGVAGASPMLPNIAGKGEGGGGAGPGGAPTPEQVVGQGQGEGGRPAGLGEPTGGGAKNVDQSKNITNNVTVNGANVPNEQSMANTVSDHQNAMYNT